METKTIKLEKVEVREIMNLYLSECEKNSTKYAELIQKHRDTENQKFFDEAMKHCDLAGVYQKQYNKFNKLYKTFK